MYCVNITEIWALGEFGGGGGISGGQRASWVDYPINTDTIVTYLIKTDYSKSILGRQ